MGGCAFFDIVLVKIDRGVVCVHCVRLQICVYSYIVLKHVISAGVCLGSDYVIGVSFVFVGFF